MSFLKLFYIATKKFSSSLYVTLNTFFDEMFVIQENIAHKVLCTYPKSKCGGWFERN